MNGFLNVLKPPGMTSSDVVLHIRRLLPRGVKVGHGGTLDPDAAGVLPVCVGRATRLFDYFIDKEKEYIAELTLGVVTDTQDATGRVIETHAVAVSVDALREALSRLVGDIWQRPPAFSAIKQGGRRMYELARKGGPVDIEPRLVRVEALDCIEQITYNTYRIYVICRKGVYVRTLMHDVGQMLGCGGHMSFLLRSRAGAFDITRSATLEEIAASGVGPLLCPLDTPLMHLPRVSLGESYRRAVMNGNPLRIPHEMKQFELARVYLNNEFAGIGQVGEERELRFRAMLLS